MPTTNSFPDLVQSMLDRIQALENRDRQKETQTFDLWTIREDDSGQLLATTDDGGSVVLAGAVGTTRTEVDVEAPVAPGDSAGGGTGDCDCPPGPPGPPGQTGDCSGCPPGPEGPDGDSAYQIAVDNGFVGTESDWLASLVGPGGPAGPAGPPGTTFAPTWTAYSPTWTATTTNPTLNNGTLTGKYIQAGKLVLYQIALTFGSTTAVGSGNYAWSLPPVTALLAQTPTGVGVVFDSSANDRRPRTSYLSSVSAAALLDNGGVRVTHNTPFAWANGDTIRLSGMYEAA